MTYSLNFPDLENSLKNIFNESEIIELIRTINKTGFLKDHLYFGSLIIYLKDNAIDRFESKYKKEYEKVGDYMLAAYLYEMGDRRIDDDVEQVLKVPLEQIPLLLNGYSSIEGEEIVRYRISKGV